MKKIMFNDRYGLTDAVLHGRKTMTRRVISNQQAIYSLDEQEYIGNMCVDYSFCERYSRYKLGETVAVAQPYKDVVGNGVWLTSLETGLSFHMEAVEKFNKGWSNKMFVASEFMPLHIVITDIKVERLQDISDIDCLREGIFQFEDPFYKHRVGCYGYFGATKNFNTPKEAFTSLIDKVSGKGTWDSNPWVFAYSFELEKGGEK